MALILPRVGACHLKEIKTEDTVYFGHVPINLLHVLLLLTSAAGKVCAGQRGLWSSITLLLEKVSKGVTRIRDYRSPVTGRTHQLGLLSP